MVVDNTGLKEVEQTGVVENLLARSTVYQILSACYLFPGEEKLALLKNKEDFCELKEKLKRCFEDSDGLSALLKSLENLREIGSNIEVEELQSIYNRIIGHTMSKECPLYEGQYGAAHVFQQVQDLADIQGFYKAFGLDISDEEKERCDHIGVEFEFMQFVLYKQAYALENHGKEESEVCLEAQMKFLKDHIGKWVPLFAILFGRKAKVGFYFELSEATRAFIALEMKLLGVKTEVLKESDLNQEAVAGAPDECLSCAGMDDGEEV